jgi:hypothetical protein
VVAAAQSDEPVVRPVGEPLSEGETATVDVVLTAAPDGLAGYYLDLTVEGEGVRIAAANYSERFGLTSEPDLGPDNRTVTLEAADIGGAVEPGATNVTLATVEVAAVGDGRSSLSVDPRQFDGDRNGSFAPVPRSETVSVGSTGTATPTTAAATARPTDDTATRTEAQVPTATATPPTAAELPATANEQQPTATAADGPLPMALVVGAVGAGLALAAYRRR